MSTPNPDNMSDAEKVQHLLRRSTITDEEFVKCLSEGNLQGLRNCAQQMLDESRVHTREIIWVTIAIDAVNRYEAGEVLSEEQRVEQRAERIDSQIRSTERLDPRDLRG